MSTMFSSKSSGVPGGRPDERGVAWRVLRGLMTAIVPPRDDNQAERARRAPAGSPGGGRPGGQPAEKPPSTKMTCPVT